VLACALGLDNGAKVINLASALKSRRSSALDEAQASGVVVVVSAGNRGDDCRSSSPAHRRGDRRGGRPSRPASFTSFGKLVALAAPGWCARIRAAGIG
jgi:subtilisin family serine protease